VKFDPGMVGQLHMYLAAVDDALKQPDDQPTIGLLLCRGKNQLVVEYALRGSTSPMGVADWETQLVDKLPADLEGSLPTIEQIEAELADVPEEPAAPASARKPARKARKGARRGR
jgi:nuclease YhcG-like protein